MYKIFLSLSALFLLTSSLNAKHIIGGEVYYNCIQQETDPFGNVTNDYIITFNMYRDCAGGGAGFDNNAQFGIYRGNGNNWVLDQIVTKNPQQIENVDINETACIEAPPGLCVQKGTYIIDLQGLDVIDENYLIVYQRCCRNNTILNIVNPESTGAVFQVEITPKAQEICNDSPQFNNFPPVVVCVDNPLVFDHSASDAEGHELVYEFCTPNESGGTKGTAENPGDATDCDGVVPSPTKCPPPYGEVIFKLPAYSFTNPLGTGSLTNINSNSGLLTATPPTIGQHVVGVCVKEYLDGELLSIVRRDFQFNVTECQILAYANIDNDEVIKEQEFLVKSCGEFTVDFTNLSQDEAYIDSYYWEFDLGNGDLFTDDQRNTSVTFPEIGEYIGTMILNPNSTDCTDTAKIFVEILPDVSADWEYVYDTCDAGPVSFTDFSESGAGFIQEWNWNMGSDTVYDQNHNYQFLTPGSKDVILEVVDLNDCRDTLNQTIDWFPAPNEITIAPNTYVGCLPAKITFNNLSFPIDETYDILWNFGDGNQDTVVSPTHEYQETGVYSVDISVISPLGCEAYKSYPYLIQVEPSPDADFIYSPEIVTNVDNIVEFTDQSDDAISWQYIINDSLAAYFQPNVTHTFQDTGLHKIDLIVFHPSGCPDTITKYIDVQPIASLYMPNAFSPNGDGVNDVFKGKGNLFGVSEFQMQIFNRWGEQVFESTDASIGWNGKIENNGADVPSGVYLYQLKYREPRGKLIEKKGTATVVR